MDEALAVRFEKIEAEDNRQNKRIEKLEENFENMQQLTLSVKELAINTKFVAEKVDSMDQRLGKMESEPGENWNSIKKTVITTVVGVLAGALATGIIILIANNLK